MFAAIKARLARRRAHKRAIDQAHAEVMDAFERGDGAALEQAAEWYLYLCDQ